MLEVANPGKQEGEAKLKKCTFNHYICDLLEFYSKMNENTSHNEYLL